MTDEEDSADVCHPSSVTQRRGRRVASRCQGESMSAAVRRRGRACLSREDTFGNSVTSRAACAQAAARLHVPHLTSGLHPVLPASTHLFAAVSRHIDRREAAMRNKTVVGIALLVLAQGVAGCSATDSSSISLGPSPCLRRLLLPRLGPQALGQLAPSPASASLAWCPNRHRRVGCPSQVPASTVNCAERKPTRSRQLTQVGFTYFQETTHPRP